MNALFLKDLANKILRGLRGRVEKGKSGGGLAPATTSCGASPAKANQSTVSGVSIGVQTGPLIGAQKGPPVRMAER
ncbi:hypothetical protein sphantq_03908 [Sphingobium sp. AntQ-1]|uniref:hypothetical protein n=1 Tax=Sphingobium sp. AntQ-1 TaxID=2930091 RepID=UPI00234F97B4|nr:hypothetical protein [Sphingobium sp. AntQ-1]WCP15447.1 hypothetical protein sphantq_03908 [Sphingobium sp. AntQ-1]